MNLTFNPEPVP